MSSAERDGALEVRMLIAVIIGANLIKDLFRTARGNPIGRDVNHNQLNHGQSAPQAREEEHVSPAHAMMTDSFVNTYAPDNVDIARTPISHG